MDIKAVKIKKYILFKVFRSLSGSIWVYDAGSNRIIRLDGLRLKDEELPALKLYLLKHDLVREFQRTERAYYYISDFNEYIKILHGCIGKLTLELTEECNLRCSYCVYSGKFKGRRTHSDKYMSFDTAVRALDLFEILSRNRKNVSICFYGGESLIRFDEMQGIIKLAREKLSSRRVSFQISSNGTLADEKFWSWMAENEDVYLNITLNGYEHDAYRKYINGRATLQDILNNLENLKFNKELQSRVNFICNAGSNSDIKSLLEFYKSHDILPSSITGIEFPDNKNNKNNKAEDSIYLELQRKYIDDDEPFLRRFFEPALVRIHNRNIIKPDNRTMIEGSCMPLSAGLFVSCFGNIGLCEKTYGFNLGNVYDGIDFDAVINLMQDYSMALENKCMGCWAQRFCSVCFSDYIIDSMRINESACDSCREQVLSDLVLYASVCEEAPDRLKRFDAAERIIEF